MDRQFLKSLNLEAESIDEIMKKYGESINDIKREKESLEAERDNLKEDISNRDQQLEDLKNNVTDTETLQAQIDSLKQSNKEKDEKRQELLNAQKLDYEIKLALNAQGARNEKAVKALLDLDTVKIGDDGDVVGLNEQLNTLKENEGWLFKTSDENVNQAQTQDSGNTDYIAGSSVTGNNGKKVTAEERARATYEKIYGKIKEEDK